MPSPLVSELSKCVAPPRKVPRSLEDHVAECAARSLELELKFVAESSLFPGALQWWSHFKSRRIPAVVNTCWGDAATRERALINCSLASVALLDGSTSLEIDKSVPQSLRFWDAPDTATQLSNLSKYLNARYNTLVLEGKWSPWYDAGTHGNLQDSSAVKAMLDYPVGTRFVVFLGKAPVRHLPGSHYIYAENVGSSVVFVDAQPNALAQSTSVPYLRGLDFGHVDIFDYDVMRYYAFSPSDAVPRIQR